MFKIRHSAAVKSLRRNRRVFLRESPQAEKQVRLAGNDTFAALPETPSDPKLVGRRRDCRTAQVSITGDRPNAILQRSSSRENAMTTIKAKAFADHNPSTDTADQIASSRIDLEETDRILDLALEDTFPASDPVSSNCCD
jgi:hypothetical protein